MGMISEAKKWKRTIEKNRVGFGRTEVSIPPFWSFVPDLQDGHDFRGKPKWTVNMKNYGRIWSYRGLDTTILKLFSRSTKWAWFQRHLGRYWGGSKVTKLEKYFCRSRKKVQNGGIETSVRPNPTLVFFKNTVPTWLQQQQKCKIELFKLQQGLQLQH